MRMSWGYARTALVAAGMLCVCGVVWTQSAADGANSTKPAMMAATADPDWDVVTVKPSDPNDAGGQRGRFDGRHVRLLGTTVEQFLLIGHGLQKDQLGGVPDWAKTERWDVDGLANMDGQMNLKQLQGMMRKILTERFGLRAHHEQREMPVFALTVAKGGSKVTPDTSDPNGFLDQQNGEANGQRTERLKNTSMAELALILQFHVDRPVVDQTGLKGRYDLKLQWTTDDTHIPSPDAPPGLFTAVQEQLGLKLEAVKAQADVLVVDAVERPGAN